MDREIKIEPVAGGSRRAERPRATVDIDLGPTGAAGSVLVDGHDVAKVVRGITVKATVGGPAEVEIDVSVRQGVKFHGQAVIGFAPELRTILLAAGWEPPKVERDPLGATPEQRRAADVAKSMASIWDSYGENVRYLRGLTADAKVKLLGVTYTAGQLLAALGEDVPQETGRSDREDEDSDPDHCQDDGSHWDEP